MEENKMEGKMKEDYNPTQVYGIMRNLVGTVQLPEAVKQRLLNQLQVFAADLIGYSTSKDAKTELTAMLDKGGLNPGRTRGQLVEILGAVLDAYLSPNQETSAPSKPSRPTVSPLDGETYPQGTRYAVVSLQDITGKLG